MSAHARHRSPDSSKIRQKMLFASSKDALRRSLDGIGAEIQATDLDEVSHETSQYIVGVFTICRGDTHSLAITVLDKVGKK